MRPRLGTLAPPQRTAFVPKSWTTRESLCHCPGCPLPIPRSSVSLPVAAAKRSNSFLKNPFWYPLDEGLVAKQSPQGLDLLSRPVREISQSTLEGLFAFPPTFAEEDGGRGVTIGDAFDVHGSFYSHQNSTSMDAESVEIERSSLSEMATLILT